MILPTALMRPGINFLNDAVAMLELAGSSIVGWNSFLDTATLFPRFGLPPAVAPEEPA